MKDVFHFLPGGPSVVESGQDGGQIKALESLTAQQILARFNLTGAPSHPRS